MFSSYIFRVTNLCDKRCPTCCCDTGIAVLKPEKFRKKLSEIAQYYQQNPEEECLIFLSGGEPFFYRSKSSNGELWSIVDVVQLITTLLPSAKIIIKTSGWDKQDALDNLFSKLYQVGAHVEIRLGFNLFQNLGVNAENRLSHMLSLILTYQPSVIVETIYSKENKNQTLNVIGKVLGRFCKEFEDFRAALSSPREAYVVDFPFALLSEDNFGNRLRVEKQVTLWTMPAHPGKSKHQDDAYFDCANMGVCTNIKNGPTQIMYNADLSFHHCNDAFADFSYPPFTAKSDWTVQDEFLFLTKKFDKLRRQMSKAEAFRSKNEQCILCSKLMNEE
ncbi:MAG: hypothetical protein NWE92_12185 [Candidatus Bathyarchaeota archaeon]|nr:hypothetical protein [Candidatus Bathyarchaeota archaeon]